jgi:Putative aminopeptidase
VRRACWASLVLFALPALALAADAPPTVEQLKSVEESAGFHRTGNFGRLDTGVRAYYRCYYTGKLELPESYDELKMRKGTKDGCALDEKKYDVFYYRIEAVASGHTPVTESLATASAERVAMVVPHEDFHAQIDGLPRRIEEAAATLVGFVTAAAALNEQAIDAELFLKKSEIVNRYFDRLGAVYKKARGGALSEAAARAEQRRLLERLNEECSAIRPDPRSFNKCVSAPNNAGLAFDHTYTKYYPVLYRVYEGCGKDLKCTAQRIMAAPRKRHERDLLAYFERLE